MSGRKKSRISMSAEDDNLGDSPFSLLNAQGLPDAPPQNIQAKEIKIKKDVCLGRGERLEIRREKSGRGGKTVTTVQGFPTHLGPSQKAKTLKTLKTTLGTGGTWNKNTMELQGDRRDDVYHWLKQAGFSPVLAGG